jgi:hypothetical protein
VIDTGIGISKDFLPYVFDRFRQADSTTTRSHSGLGLGLAIVRHLVELHSGTVHVDSDGEGQGAIFTVKLALLKKREEEGEITKGQEEHVRYLRAEVSPPPPTRVAPTQCELEAKTPSPSITPSPLTLDNLQILVVDDDTDTRDFLSTVLKQHGAEVTPVASVIEALQALQQLKPDVLISDIGMPGEDGYGLIRKLRALEAERGGKIPAIALTAYASGEERMRALSAGFQIHLPKPVEPAELIAVVANFKH